jgi:exopolysaccharide biosynthesis polyprenyl glycosylphosphotransferase
MAVPPVDAIMMCLPILWGPQHAKAVLSCAVLTMLLLYNGRGYRARLHLSVLDELPWLLGRFSIAVAAVGTVIALRHDAEAVTSFLVTSTTTAALLVGGRVLTSQVILWARRRGSVAHRTIIVGTGPVATELVAVLARYPQYGLRVVGVVDTQVPEGFEAPWLGPPNVLRDAIDDLGVAAILLADGVDERVILDLVKDPTARSWELLVVPRLHQLHTQVGLPDHVGSIPVMRINQPALHGPAWAAKRLFDVLVGVGLLVALAPVFLLISVAIAIEGRGKVLFRQERVGRYGRPFVCLKFRTMRPVDPAESSTQWSVACDDRVGWLGRWLRRTSADELPQLWNVVRGDMTLVGPRPERPHFVSKFSAEVPRYEHRHRVRAGLTGFAQVSGLRGDTPIVDRARFDNYYIENWSLWMDVKVLLRTVVEVLFARGR